MSDDDDLPPHDNPPHVTGGANDDSDTAASLDDLTRDLCMLITGPGYDVSPELRLVIRGKVVAAYTRGYKRGRRKGRAEGAADHITNP